MLRFLVVVCLVAATQADFSGDSCTDANMLPDGRDESEKSSKRSPYRIELSSEQYSAGGAIDVTLEGEDEPFTSFMILALPYDNPTGTPLGSFQADQITTICNGMGATNTSVAGTAYRRITLKWSVPSSLVGNIIFYATFMKQEEFWPKVASAPVWDGISDLPVTPAMTTTRQPSPTLSMTNVDCGNTKSCYGECQDQVCDFLVSWKKSDTKVQFELFGTLNNSEGYVAVGLGKTPAMSDVSIVACSIDSEDNVQVEQYYASDKSTPKYVNVGPISADNWDVSVSQDEEFKTIFCSFTYDNEVAKQRPEMWKNLDEELFVFIARGEYSPQMLSKHGSTPNISPRAVVLANTEFDNIKFSRVNYLIKAHACIMVLAWVFCGSVGVMLARYYKPMWTDTKACGQKVWFSYHRALMLCTMFLTIIGFILILVYQKGKFVTPKDLPQKAHPILGLIALICALLNPILAAIRCDPAHSARPCFNWFHWFFGTVAYIFAIVAIFLGMLMTHAVVPGWITYIMMGFCLFHVCVEFMLEIHWCCMYDKNRDRQEEYLMGSKLGQGKEPKYAGRGFKCAMFVIYMIVVSLVTIALIVIIALWGSVNI